MNLQVQVKAEISGKIIPWIPKKPLKNQTYPQQKNLELLQKYEADKRRLHQIIIKICKIIADGASYKVV